MEIVQGLGRAKDTFLNFIEIPVERAISTKTQGKFLLIKYSHDENREQDLLECILNNLVNYALTAEEQKDIGNVEKVRALSKKAISRFVKNSKTGEFGEVILFHLLEVIENAVQVVNKISLKTNGNVHYHGADAVHFGINGDLRILYLGESKTEQLFDNALTNAIKSLEGYEEKDKKEFEINLASGNLSDHLPLNLQEEIKEYLDPLKADRSKYVETYAVLLCFNYAVLAALEKEHEGENLLKEVINTYKKNIESLVKKIEEKVSASQNLNNKRFLFFVLPFKNLSGMKAKFIEGLNP